MGAFLTSAAALALLMIPLAQARDQAPARSTTTVSDAATLAAGWTALAAGQQAAAAREAAKILARTPWNHAALTLRIEALSAGDPLRALDAYEAWLANRTREDAGLLEPAARAILRQIARGADADLRHDARRALAAAGVVMPAAAPDQEDQLDADAARAKDGDAAARKRLQTAVTAGTIDPATLADALASAGPAGTPMLMTMLTSAAGPSRAAAAAALGRRKVEEAKSALQKLMTDPDPYVRSTAAVALGRMGDPQAMTIVERMLQSEVPDLRIMAAEAYDGQNGAWVSAIMPLLENRDGVTRLQAARLIAPVNPEAARRTLQEAAGDPNPVIRAEAVRVMGDVAGRAPEVTDLSQARRLLRDADPGIRVHAAAAVLAAARAGF
jgi:HEAT repeat protein